MLKPAQYFHCSPFAGACALVCALLGGCAVGPDYQRPPADTGALYKETAIAAASGWKTATPQDHLERGDWWTIYGDAQLDALQQQLAAANQNIAAAAAAYRQAHAAVQQTRASFLPNLSASAARTRSSGDSNSGAQALGTRNLLQLDASWELDVWGRIRRAVEASSADAQTSAADLAAARLSAQAELALNYFQLRVIEAQQALYARTVADYTRSLQVTRNQYAVGVAGRADILQAEAQLRAAQAQAVDLGVQRGQLEHAIAVLIGTPPAAFTLAAGALPAALPAIPVGLPSELLERRPDIAGAERQMAAANARIGVARAAYFPTLTLSGSVGYASSSFSDWLSAPNRFWSLGPALALTLFDAGARNAQSEQALAAYDQTVAIYRQTVLTGLQEVEDNLISLTLLHQELDFQAAAVQSARDALALVNNQYAAGTVSFLNVISAETTALSNERTALLVRGQQFAASVNLVKALGGDWNGQLPAD